MNKTIYIVHGWTYTTEGWDTCMYLLRKKGYEPIMLNVPGLTEFSNKVWALEDYIAWLGAKLPQGGTTLMGHSNGGRIAIALAARYPKRIGRLILEDAAGIVHNEFPLRIKRFVFKVFSKILKKFTPARIRQYLYRIVGASDYGRADENMRKTMQGLIAHDLSESFPLIQCPTLIVWGGDDKTTPLSDAHIMHKQISNSTLIVLDNVGHSPHKTAPEMTAEAITEWLD